MADQQANDVSPQELLHQARAGLLTALIAAEKAVDDPNATPAMLQAALNGLGPAQQQFNNAIVRIPIAVMIFGAAPRRPYATTGHESEASPEPPQYPWNPQTDSLAHELLQTANGRKWADAFLAVTRAEPVDRETLVGWFSNAIETGRASVAWDRAATPD